MVNGERRPTVKEVLKRIDEVPTAKKSGIIYKNALRYIYLTAGRVSELAGDYNPRGTDAHQVEIESSDAVMFLVKTARHRGRIRPIALPAGYEPWANLLGTWFKVHEESHPFGGLSMRSFQLEAGELFDGLMWPVDEYKKLIYVNIKELQIIRERQKEDGSGIEYLIQYPNDERRWIDDILAPIGTETRVSHWRPFTLDSLRQLRIWELRNTYGFSDVQIDIYSTGLSETQADLRLPDWVYKRGTRRTISDYAEEASLYYSRLLKKRE